MTEGLFESVPDARRRLMARIGGKNTLPEIRVRRVAHAMGLRYRLHRRDLPGTPDLVFPRYGAVLFVHGCFWHRHLGCRRCTSPKTRAEYWQAKFDANVARDRRDQERLRDLGWRVATIWECETVDGQSLRRELQRTICEGPWKEPSP